MSFKKIIVFRKDVCRDIVAITKKFLGKISKKRALCFYLGIIMGLDYVKSIVHKFLVFSFHVLFV